MRLGVALGLGLTALSCAAMHPYEKRRVVGARPVDEWLPPGPPGRVEASTQVADDTVIIGLIQRRACPRRTGQIADVEVRKGRAPDSTAVGLEGGCAVLGAAAVVPLLACDESGDFACLGQAMIALVGIPVFIGCGIAYLVDVNAGSETVERRREDRTKESVIDCSAPLPHAPVELQLPDGTQRVGRSDSGGHARFDLSDAPWQDGQLRVGISSSGRPVARRTLRRGAE